MRPFKTYLLAVVVIAIHAWSGYTLAQGIEIARFTANEARQGVAVDDHHIYVIGTQEIGKYDKKTFAKVGSWQGAEDGTIIHLNSGVIPDSLLYCAHSNYPDVPMTSSVEIWNKYSLEHLKSHSFGVYRGSCTWIDRYKDSWWAVFAQYDKWKAKTFKGTEWTTLVQFDDHWNEKASWVFPSAVIDEFRPMSNSGGSWGLDGLLYCTGHDSTKLYAFKLPKTGSMLELIKTIQVPFYGQGIAWDRSTRNEIYGIRKKGRSVFRVKIPRQ